VRGGASIDGARSAEYATEPLVVVQEDKPLAQTVEESLERVARIGPASLRRFREGGTYYPSPGGLEEQVRSMFVEIEPLFVEERLAPFTGWSTSGRVRAIEAQQVLRAAQVGGLPDARLELNVYELLLRLGREVGPWIGESIELGASGASAARAGTPAPEVTTVAALQARPPRRVFTRAHRDRSPRFLDLRCSFFEEVDAAGAVVARRPLELVTPRTLQACTVVAALLLPPGRHGATPLLGIDDDDLPAAQCFHGHSELLVAPAWRLPRGLTGTERARAWIRERLRAEYGVATGRAWELGGRYHPSSGVTPEVVYPMAFEVMGEEAAPRRARWVPLSDLVQHAAGLRDGHLRVVALRAAHALGILGAGRAS
jgi:hypothetical protein